MHTIIGEVGHPHEARFDHGQVHRQHRSLYLFGVAAGHLGRFTVKLPGGRYTVSLVLKGGTAHAHQTVLIREGHVSRVRLVELAP